MDAKFGRRENHSPQQFRRLTINQCLRRLLQVFWSNFICQWIAVNLQIKARKWWWVTHSLRKSQSTIEASPELQLSGTVQKRNTKNSMEKVSGRGGTGTRNIQCLLAMLRRIPMFRRKERKDIRWVKVHPPFHTLNKLHREQTEDGNQ